MTINIAEEIHAIKGSTVADRQRRDDLAQYAARMGIWPRVQNELSALHDADEVESHRESEPVRAVHAAGGVAVVHASPRGVWVSSSHRPTPVRMSWSELRDAAAQAEKRLADAYGRALRYAESVTETWERGL